MTDKWERKETHMSNCNGSRDGPYYVIRYGGRPHRFLHNNFSSVYRIFTKLGHMIPLWKRKNPIYFGVITIIPFDNLYRRAYFVMHLWPNDPKINRDLPLPHGNHVVKFGKDPIYRTKVIMWKPPYCQKFDLGRGRTLFMFGSLGQRSRSPLL
jgi:hypothetical protein